MSRGVLDVHLDPGDWAKARAELDQFDPSLTRALRKNLRIRGESLVQAIRSKLGEATPEGNPSGPGRAALIAGTRASVSFAARGGGVRIVTSGSGLPAGHLGLLKVYNLASFRHPVFESGNQRITRTFTGAESGRSKRQRTRSGELAAWVTESGNPYFDKVIEKNLDLNILRDMEGALNEAISAIGAHL